VVAAVEHADGTACCAELADGEWRLLQGLGTGAVLEAKCEYRVQECVTMARALQAMNAGGCWLLLGVGLGTGVALAGTGAVLEAKCEYRV
jgi:hypothetical protein